MPVPHQVCLPAWSPADTDQLVVLREEHSVSLPGEGTLRRVFVTENDFRADGAAAHAGLTVFALGTASPEMLSELLKEGISFPRLRWGTPIQNRV